MEHEEKKQDIPTIKRALLIEDYKPCQIIMFHYLKEHYQQIDLVVESSNAIKNIENKTYDLIIGDINLQGCLSGKKIIQMIRKSKLNVGTPLIVWSAYVNEKDEEKYLSWGADAALIKACNRKDVEKVIQQCLLTPRYEREYLYKLKTLQKEWKESGGPIEWARNIRDFCQSSFPIIDKAKLIADKAKHIINEYQCWVNVSTKEEKNPL